MLNGSVSNDQFLAKYNDPDIQGLIKSFCAKFSKQLNYDEMVQAGRIALYKAMLGHKESFGQKFTTSLYHFLYWEFLKLIKEKKIMCSLKRSYVKVDVDTLLPKRVECNGEIDEFQSPSPYINAIDFSDCMDQISEVEKQLLEEYYFDRRTLKELSSMYGITIEGVRQRLIKAGNSLKEVLDR